MICDRLSTRKNQQFRIDNRTIFRAEFICLFTMQIPGSFRKQMSVSGTRECRVLHGRSPVITVHPITVQKNVVVFDGSLALQVIVTCYGLETMVIDKPLAESSIEKRNNSDICYKCCQDYMAFSHPEAGYRLVSLVVNCAEKFKGARKGHHMAFIQRGSMNNREWLALGHEIKSMTLGNWLLLSP